MKKSKMNFVQRIPSRTDAIRWARWQTATSKKYKYVVRKHSFVNKYWNKPFVDTGYKIYRVKKKR